MAQGIGYKDADGSYGFRLTEDGKVILGNSSDDVIQITGTLSVNGTIENPVGSTKYPLFKAGDYHTWYSSYGAPTLQNPHLTNTLYLANTRFAFDANVSNAHKLFNGEYNEGAISTIASGSTTSVFTLNLTSSGVLADAGQTNGVTYPQGFFVLHFHASSGGLTDASQIIVTLSYNDDSESVIPASDIEPLYYNTEDYRNVWKVNLASTKNYLQKIKLDIKGGSRTGGDTSLVEVEYYQERIGQTGLDFSGFTKYTSNIMYNDLDFRNSSNTEVASITNSGVGTFASVAATTLAVGGTTITATGTELNYVDGVTSAIQTQLDAKAPSTGIAAGALASDCVTAAKIATAVAGDGITGGGGSALAVGAGTGVTVNANDVAIGQAVGTGDSVQFNKLTVSRTSATSTPAIEVDCANNDISLLRADSATAGQYGWEIKYLGTGAGDANRFALVMDNQNGTDKDAILVDQDGEVRIPQNLSVTGSLICAGGITGDLSVEGTLTVPTLDGGAGNLTLTAPGSVEIYIDDNDTSGASNYFKIKGTSDVEQYSMRASDGIGGFSARQGFGVTSPLNTGTNDGIHIYSTANIGASTMVNAPLLIGTSTTTALGIDNNQISTDGGDLYLTTVDADDIQIKSSNNKVAIFSSLGEFFLYNSNGTSGTYDKDSYWKMVESNGSGNLLFYFKTHTGSEAEKGYLRSDTDVSAIDFTGQHRSLPSDNTTHSELSSSVGKIVVSDGTYGGLVDEDVTINDAIPKVKLSNTQNQKTVFGVISDAEDTTETSRSYVQGIFGSVADKNDENDHRIIINSLGEGGIWITNINGNIENGDYITTCEIPGYGMKQDDDLLHNYTVAKITQDCLFDLNSTTYECEEIQHNGQTYRAAFVGCTYHCG